MMNEFPYLRPLPDRRDALSREQLLCRVRAEFEEMRCLRLTRLQAQRLFGLRADVCERVLAALVAKRILCRESDERYRYDEDAAHRASAAPGRREGSRSQAS